MLNAPRAYSGPNIHIYISNVYQPNSKFSRLLKQVRKEDPDIVFLVETDAKWKDALQELESKYPYHILHPADNTYGMLLYSRYELNESTVRFLIKDDIPSIRCSINIPEAGEVQFFGVHPEPPSPTENEYSTERDAELLRVARECEREKRPIIVAGDLNDVAWSYTTERFIRISGLVDPRRGRGIFATFHAKHFFMRWPLDHIFCSSHFSLIKMRRKRAIGSDHFPVSIRMALSGEDSSSFRQR